MEQVLMTPDEIRDAYEENSGKRDRDLAETLGITEGQLVAAFVGHDVTVISPSLDDIFPKLKGLGEVMALTRNRSCVIEKVGQYDNYHSGAHASMVLADEIDMRMFPSHWVHAFAIERKTENDVKRSLQVFDAAGDAVHKIFLRDGSDLDNWKNLVDELESSDQSQTLNVEPRNPPEAARANPDKIETLRSEWAKLTDTHQFMRLTSKLKMNRLGAYRIAGEPFARKLEIETVTQMFEQVRERELEVMVFVGNRGCIEIHGGLVRTLKQVGPWFNVLDSRFNLHLRSDHISEVWAVSKPTQRGPAVSIEAFDAEDRLIFQIFGRHSTRNDFRPAWNELVDNLESKSKAEVA